MSDKKLLEEAQVRRMFQLAGIPAIGESFIGDKFSRFNEEEDEEAPMGDEMGEPAAEEDPMAAAAEEPAAEEPAPAAGGEIPQDKVEAIVDAVLAGIEEETGVPLERVPEGGEAPAEEPAEAGAEEGEEVVADAGMDEEEPEMALEREIVSEVARRVARRLIRKSAEVRNK